MKNWWQNYTQWWRGLTWPQQWRVLGVSLATIIGASYRLVNLEETLQFLGDQGRDAIIAYGILHGDFTLVGPSTSVGSMFLGPLYYYFMVPWLWLAGNNPLGPALVVALIGVVTVPLLYWVGRRLVGPVPAFLATLLYATAPTVITFTRFSWNPNPAPIITLAMLYAGWRAWHGSANWWLGVAVGWLVIIQLHYVALLSIVPFVILGVIDLWRSWHCANMHRVRQIGLVLLASLGLFLVSISTLIIFNWRFDNVIIKGFVDFFDSDPSAPSLPLIEKLTNFLREHHGRGMHVLFEIWGAEWTQWYREINTWLLATYAVLFGGAWYSHRRSHYAIGYTILGLFTLISISGLSAYRMTLHPHYFSYFYPVSYLLTGTALATLAKWFKWPGALAALIIFVYINWLAVQPEQLRYLKPMGWQLSDMRAVAERIAAEVPDDRTYSLATLSEFRDYRGLNYRYFLEIDEHPPVPQEEFHSAELLVIVAETPRIPEEVLNSPAYEIKEFPRGDYWVVEEPGWPVLYFVNRQAGH